MNFSSLAFFFVVVAEAAAKIKNTHTNTNAEKLAAHCFENPHTIDIVLSWSSTCILFALEMDGFGFVPAKNYSPQHFTNTSTKWWMKSELQEGIAGGPVAERKRRDWRDLVKKLGAHFIMSVIVYNEQNNISATVAPQTKPINLRVPNVVLSFIPFVVIDHVKLCIVWIPQMQPHLIDK